MKYIPVAKSTEVGEGDIHTVDGVDFPLAVARSEGTLYAFYNDCSHEYCPLSGGWLEQGEIECACHGSIFDLSSGEPLNPPADEPIAIFPVREQDGQILVGIDDETPS